MCLFDFLSLQVNATSIYDNFSIVAEGVKQYANYTASHAVKKSGTINRDPFPLSGKWYIF